VPHSEAVRWKQLASQSIDRAVQDELVKRYSRKSYTNLVSILEACSPSSPDADSDWKVVLKGELDEIWKSTFKLARMLAEDKLDVTLEPFSIDHGKEFEDGTMKSDSTNFNQGKVFYTSSFGMFCYQGRGQGRDESSRSISLPAVVVLEDAADSILKSSSGTVMSTSCFCILNSAASRRPHAGRPKLSPGDSSSRDISSDKPAPSSRQPQHGGERGGAFSSSRKAARAGNPDTSFSSSPPVKLSAEPTSGSAAKFSGAAARYEAYLKPPGGPSATS
jgi:hypothetical protein